MLDGLDEISDSDKRRHVGQWVNRQISNYSRAWFILTSRPHGYSSNPLEQVRVVLEVQPFNFNEIEQFLKNWYLQYLINHLNRDDPGVHKLALERAADLRRRITDHPALAAMAVNPLLLTMIAILHEHRGNLPDRRVELYAEICQVLLSNRLNSKSWITSLSTAKQQRVLQSLALALMENNTRSFDLDKGLKYINQRLMRVAGQKSDAKDFLREIEKLSGLLVQIETDVYEFMHKSFQEYLAAVEINESYNPDYFLNKLTDPVWAEAIRLYAVQTGDVSKLIQAMFIINSVDSLSLAYDCIEEGAEILPEIRQALFDRIDTGIESSDPALSELAARVKLSQRLKHLFVRLGENFSVDLKHISCAEYQLFINDRFREGVNRKPSHWTRDRFISGYGNQPITGIKVIDALDFCNWLNQKYPDIGFSYSIPLYNEDIINKNTNNSIGFFVKKEDSIMLEGLSPILTEKYRELFFKSRVNDYDFDFSKVISKAIDLDHLFSQDISSTIDYARSNSIDRELILILVYAIDFVENRNDNDVCRLSFSLARDNRECRSNPIEKSTIIEHSRNIIFDIAAKIDLELIRNKTWNTQIRSGIIPLDNIFNRAYTAMHGNFDYKKLRSILSALSIVLALLLLASSRKKNNKLIIKFESLLQINLELYAFNVINDERHNGNLPALESICISKNKIII